ncbi:MAG: hypothetical protein ACOYNY_03910 [Caldilineaceae bacterium]|jgi:hypothetical protein
MLRLSVIQHQWWLKRMQPLLMLLYALSVLYLATPGDISDKPIPKEPPWPPVCQMAPDRLPCGLIY